MSNTTVDVDKVYNDYENGIILLKSSIPIIPAMYLSIFIMNNINIQHRYYIV